jgi:hypothetical protein
MPFFEEGAEEILQRVLQSGHLHLSLDPEVKRRNRYCYYHHWYPGGRAPEPRVRGHEGHDRFVSGARISMSADCPPYPREASMGRRSQTVRGSECVF